MLFLRWLYGAESWIGQLNCIYLQEITTPVKSVRTQSLGFPSSKPVKMLSAHMCAGTYIHTYKYKKFLLHNQTIYLVL